MRQVTDWVFSNAGAIVGGTFLFLAFLAVFAVAAKRERSRNEKRMEDKDPREGE